MRFGQCRDPTAEATPEPEQVLEEQETKKPCKRSAAPIRAGELVKNGTAVRLEKESKTVPTSTAAEPPQKETEFVYVNTAPCEPPKEPPKELKEQQHALVDAAAATPPAKFELPQLPSDWAEASFATPEDQPTPKKRGRKPKDKEPKAKAEPKRGRESKAKSGKDGAKDGTHDAAKDEDMIAVPKKRARKDKQAVAMDRASEATDRKQRTSHRPRDHEPQKEPTLSKPPAKDRYDCMG